MRSLLFFVLLLGAYLLLAGRPDGWNVWVRSFLAVVFLTAGLEIWRRNKKSKADKMQAFRKPVAVDYLAALVAIALLVFSVTWSSIEVSESKVLEAISMSRSVGPITDEKSDDGEGGDKLWDDGLSRKLAKSSDYKLKSTAEVYLKLLGDEGRNNLEQKRVYLRGFSFSSFDGTKWQAAERFKKVLQSEGQIDFAEIEAEIPVYRQQITVRSRADGQNLMLAMPRVKNVQLERLTQSSEGIFLLPVSGEKIYKYTVESQPLDDRMIAGMAPQFSVGDAGVNYLELPEELVGSSKIRDLTSEVGSEISVAEQLEFIRTLLRGRCSYSLKVENKQGLDSLENFLFEEKVGYCEHFASAAAILCRELKIPSRIAYGYSGGVYYPKADLRVFRARDAHAWTEVFLKDYGWVVFDTTPTSGVNQQTASDTDTVPSLEKKPEEAIELESKNRSNCWWLGVLIFSLIGCGVCLFYWKSRRLVNGENSVLRKPKHEYFLFLQSACHQLGVNDVEAKTMRELIVFFEKSGRDTTLLEKLAEYHNGVIYQGAQRDTKLEREFVAKLSEWAS